MSDVSEKPKSNQLRDKAVSRGERLFFTVDQLEPYPGLNVRNWDTAANQQRIADMADSIFAFGVRTPLDILNVRDSEGVDHIYIRNGETRWRGVRKLVDEGRMNAEDLRIPTVVVRPENEVDANVSLLVSNDQQNFHPLEIAAIFKRFVDWGMTQKEIAEKINKPLYYVAHIMPLLQISVELRRLLEEDVVSTSTVLTAINKYGVEKGTELLVAGVAVEQQRRAEELAEADAALTVATLEATTAPQEPPRPGRRPLSPGDRAIKAAQKERDLAAKQAQARISAATVLPRTTSWQNDPNVVKLLAGIRYAIAWTEETDTFKNLNATLTSVGLDAVVSRRMSFVKQDDELAVGE